MRQIRNVTNFAFSTFFYKWTNGNLSVFDNSKIYYFKFKIEYEFVQMLFFYKE